MRITLAVTAALLLLPGVARSQSPFSIEVGGDVAVPVQDFGNLNVNTGYGLGANLRYAFMPRVAGYAGWEWQHFTGDLLSADRTINETGFAFGLRYDHPIGMGNGTARRAPTLWLRAGGLLDHVSLKDANGDPAGHSSYGLGWEGGLGLEWPISDRLAVAPGVRMRQLRREFDMGLGLQKSTLSYIAAGVGVVVGF